MNAIQDLNDNPKRWQRVHALLEEFIADTSGNGTAVTALSRDCAKETTTKDFRPTWGKQLGVGCYRCGWGTEGQLMGPLCNEM
jgi:hypothetical protein